MGERAVAAGDVVWASLDLVRGREQGGHRPCLIVLSDSFHDAVTTLLFVTPVTTVDRGWVNHVLLTGPSGLSRPSWAMTEQVRVLSRDRMTSVAGSVSRDARRGADVGAGLPRPVTAVGVAAPPLRRPARSAGVEG